MEIVTESSQLGREQLELVSHHPLFKGVGTAQVARFLDAAKPYYMEIEEGQIVRLPAELSNYISVVFSGHVIVYGVDYSGNRLLHNSLENAKSSGTLFSILDYRNTLVEIEGKMYSQMFFIDRDSIYRANEKILSVQHSLLTNLIESQRQMFNDLSWHLYCLCQRSIRDKILKFLQFCVEHFHGYEFDIPFSREDLANYLAVDRASLSRSLGELKNEGIIDFRKNHFIVLSSQHFKHN